MSLLLYAVAFSACSSPVAPPESPGAPPGIPGAPPAQTTTPIPASIDATGTDDVSASLQEWIDSLPDNTRILGPAGARYRVEFGIEVKSKRGLHFDAADPNNRPTLFQTVLAPYTSGTPAQNANNNQNRHLLSFKFGGGHTLRNWVLHGAQPNFRPYLVEYESQYGLKIAGVDRMLVEDVFITEVAGDFVILVDPIVSPGVRARNKNITLRRITGLKAARQGITPIGVENGLIENCDLREMARSAIDIEPDGTEQVLNLTIRNNRFETFFNNWISSAGNGSATIDNLVIEDNEVVGRPLAFMIRGATTYGNLGTPPNLRKSRIYVRRNRAHSIPVITSSSVRVMEFTGIDGVEVADNVVEFNGELPIKVGAYFNEACGITYTGNSWGNAKYDNEVTVDYDPVTGQPLTEFDRANLEWPGCAGLVRMPH
jgi:hypothetical protein